MLSIVDVKEGLITYLKSKTSITDKLSGGANEIREVQWQGVEFTYPNVRVRIRELVPYNDCGLATIASHIYVFSEDASSKEADEIAGIIANELNENHFSSAGVAYNLWVTDVISAIRQDIRTWRAEVLVSGKVS
jgi:hypothetical protein